MRGAYRQGYNDYVAGFGLADCPFTDEDDGWETAESWRQGWEDAQLDDIEAMEDFMSEVDASLAAYEAEEEQKKAAALALKSGERL